MKSSSRPLRARGLKQFVIRIVSDLPLSRPLRARGLKLYLQHFETNPGESRPLRARGLKQSGMKEEKPD